MCREMLVLEERELACVEVKGKMEGGRLTKPGRETCPTGKCKNGVGARGRARERERERRGGRTERDCFTQRETTQRATNSVTTGPSRQSPLQETQIKADLSSQDLFWALPTGSLRPGAVLFPSAPRSVEGDDKDPEVATPPPPPKQPPSLTYSTRVWERCVT